MRKIATKTAVRKLSIIEIFIEYHELTFLIKVGVILAFHYTL
jgi:hypothetical protein